MAYTYRFCDEFNSTIERTDDDGQVAYVPCAEGNRDYMIYLSSGIIADEYQEPAVPMEPTPAEKLALAGLSVEELQALLGL